MHNVRSKENRRGTKNSKGYNGREAEERAYFQLIQRLMQMRPLASMRVLTSIQSHSIVYKVEGVSPAWDADRPARRVEHSRGSKNTSMCPKILPLCGQKTS